jgi:hypothetical protein
MESHPDALDSESIDNIGVVLGDASKGIVDVDIDRPSALPLAEFFLPKTGMIFGRKSERNAHWIYRCADAGRTNECAGTPAPISWEALEEAVLDLAIATELLPFYAVGCRHDMALCLVGFFRRAGWPEKRTAFLFCCCTAGKEWHGELPRRSRGRSNISYTGCAESKRPSLAESDSLTP